MARLTAPPRLAVRWTHNINDHVIAIGWSPNGSTVAVASVAGPVFLLDVASGTINFQLSGHGFGTTDLAWSPDGKRLATSGQDGKVRLWNPATGEILSELEGGATWVEHLAWSPKGEFLVSAAGKKLRLWNSEGSQARAYKDSLSTIAAIDWSPRGKEIAAAGYGGVSLLRPDADEPVNQFPWKGSLLTLAWSPDGKMLAGGAQDCSVHFWYVKSGKDLEMAGYPNKVRELSWDSTSRFLATGGGEAVTVWDCSGKGPAGSKPLTFELHEKPISALAFQNRGPFLASAAPDGKLAIWYPEGAKKLQCAIEFNEAISKLAWSASDGRLLVGGENGAVGMYSV